MSVTEFVGVSAEQVSAGHTGMYEFVSTDGHHIYLHDADLLRVSYEPGLAPRLTTLFVYEPEWVPDSLTATPAIVLAFDDVRITEWTEDAEALVAMSTDAEAASSAGQSSLFDWHPPNTFHLETLLLSLTFTAERAEVSVRPT